MNDKDLKIKEWNFLKVDLKGKTTGKIRTLCPFCSADRKHKTEKCFSIIDIASGLYKCQHCSRSGSIHKWEHINKKNYTRPEKIKSLGSTYSKELLEYFKKRGISETTLKKAKVTETKEYMPQTKKEEHVVCFNYFRDETLINIKYRTF